MAFNQSLNLSLSLSLCSHFAITRLAINLIPNPHSLSNWIHTDPHHPCTMPTSSTPDTQEDHQPRMYPSQSHPIESYNHHCNQPSKSESDSIQKSTTSSSFSSTTTATAATTKTTASTSTASSLMDTSMAREQPSVHNHHWSDYKSSGHVASSGRTGTAHPLNDKKSQLTMRNPSTARSGSHQKSKSISLPLSSPGHKTGSFLYSKTTGSSISSPTFPFKASSSMPNVAQRRRRANLLRVRIERGLVVGMGLLAGYRMMTLDYSSIKGVLSSQRSGDYRRPSQDAMPILAKSAWSLGAGKYDDNCSPSTHLHTLFHFIPKIFFPFPAIPAVYMMASGFFFSFPHHIHMSLPFQSFSFHVYLWDTESVPCTRPNKSNWTLAHTPNILWTNTTLPGALFYWNVDYQTTLFFSSACCVGGRTKDRFFRFFASSLLC